MHQFICLSNYILLGYNLEPKNISNCLHVSPSSHTLRTSHSLDFSLKIVSSLVVLILTFHVYLLMRFIWLVHPYCLGLQLFVSLPSLLSPPYIL